MPVPRYPRQSAVASLKPGLKDFADDDAGTGYPRQSAVASLKPAVVGVAAHGGLGYPRQSAVASLKLQH